MQQAGIGNSKLKKQAAKLAKHGRNGDTVLAHISPAESALLSIGGKTKNPDTGLDEHFAFMPILIGAALGGISSAASGGNFLKGALLGAAMGGIGEGITGALGSAETAAGTAAAAGTGAEAVAAGATAVPEAMYAPGAVGVSELAAPAVAAGTPAAAAASGGIGQGIMDYFASPMGAMSGLSTVGSLLTPKYEPEDAGIDEDYVQTDFTPRQSVFQEEGYDSTRQGRSGYRYAKGGGIGKYAEGGTVPYKPASDEGTSGEAVFPTADNVHSYGTRGEVDFFPNRRTEPSPGSEAGVGGAGSFGSSGATITGWDGNTMYLSDGRAMLIPSNGLYGPNAFIPVGTSLSDELGDTQAYYQYTGNYGVGKDSTYQDLLKALVPSYFAKGGASSGIGGGKDDKIPAMLSDGEHVVTADEVSDLGDGSNNEGQRKMYEFRKEIRKHKNKAGIGHRPKAKKPSEYMKAANA